MSATKLVFATSAILLMAAGLSAHNGVTSKSVAALKANLGNPAGWDVDEVRVTDAGVACIEYSVSNEKGGKSRGHAVVQGDEVLKSSANGASFKHAWDQHCLVPRDGASGGE